MEAAGRGVSHTAQVIRWLSLSKVHTAQDHWEGGEGNAEDEVAGTGAGAGAGGGEGAEDADGDCTLWRLEGCRCCSGESVRSRRAGPLLRCRGGGFGRCGDPHKSMTPGDEDVAALPTEAEALARDSPRCRDCGNSEDGSVGDCCVAALLPWKPPAPGRERPCSSEREERRREACDSVDMMLLRESSLAGGEAAGDAAGEVRWEVGGGEGGGGAGLGCETAAVVAAVEGGAGAAAGAAGAVAPNSANCTAAWLRKASAQRRP